MAIVTMPPTEEARTVFRRLGYVVPDDGPQFVAERKWRRVQVTPLCADDASEPERGLFDETDAAFRCFVTWKECTSDLLEFLRRRPPAYEYAVIGVDDSGDFDVVDAASAA